MSIWSQAIRVAIAGAVCAATSPASAALTYVTSQASLGASDVIEWNQIGPVGSIVATPEGVASVGGLSATVLSTGGQVQLLEEDNGWIGNFTVGQPILYSYNSGALTLNFASAVSAVGAFVSSDLYGSYRASLSVNGGTPFEVFGVVTPDQDGSALFLGVKSDSNDILSVSFLALDQFDGTFFAVSDVYLSGPVSAIPEPATWATMIIGFGLVGGALRRAKRAGSMSREVMPQMA